MFKRYLYAATFIFLGYLSFASPANTPEKALGNEAPKPGWTTTAHVVNVVDGDTVDVEIRKRLRVRLLDCWAPESRTRDVREKVKGLASKRHLQKMLDGKEVVLHIPTRKDGDIKKVLTLNRVLGEIYLQDANVSEEMVSAGHATKEKQTD